MKSQTQLPERRHNEQHASLSFGQRLQRERARMGLSQNQFAELGGVKRSSQHLYEHDVRNPDAGYLAKIQAGGADVGFLFSGMEGRSIHGLGALSVEQALTAFRSVEDFARKAGIDVVSVKERERLFEFLCSTLAGDSMVREELDLQSRLAERIAS